MKDCMNQPIKRKWCDIDVVADYKVYHDVRTVARIYQITTQEVRSILKRNGVL